MQIFDAIRNVFPGYPKLLPGSIFSEEKESVLKQDIDGLSGRNVIQVGLEKKTVFDEKGV